MISFSLLSYLYSQWPTLSLAVSICLAFSCWLISHSPLLNFLYVPIYPKFFVLDSELCHTNSLFTHSSPQILPQIISCVNFSIFLSFMNFLLLLFSFHLLFLLFHSLTFLSFFSVAGLMLSTIYFWQQEGKYLFFYLKVLLNFSDYRFHRIQTN